MVYLAHHADAVGPDVDPQRPLSATGRMHADAIARDAKQRGVSPAVIWHSGKLRARQTAEAYRRACNPLAEFAAIRGLQPTDPPEWIRDRLIGESREVLLVGHMPSLPAILRLLTRDQSATFPLHGLVALRESGGGEGVWIEAYQLTL
jgi:phosphohistidine phosphatase